MPRIPLTIAALLVSTSFLAASPFPWKLERPYEYAWYSERAKVGEIVVVFKETEDPQGKLVQLDSHRRLDLQGRSSRATSTLYTRPDGTLVRYTEEATYTLPTGTARQDTEIRRSGDVIRATTINNQRKELAAKNRTKAPKETYLFAGSSLEHWLHFTRHLVATRPAKTPRRDSVEASESLKKDAAPPKTTRPTPGAENDGSEGDANASSPAVEKTPDSKPRSRTFSVYYPDFAKVLKIRFTEDGEETIRIGKKRIAARKFRFRYVEYDDEGVVWVDTAGRLLQYRSGSTRLTLTGV